MALLLNGIRYDRLGESGSKTSGGYQTDSTLKGVINSFVEVEDYKKKGQLDVSYKKDQYYHLENALIKKQLDNFKIIFHFFGNFSFMKTYSRLLFLLLPVIITMLKPQKCYKTKQSQCTWKKSSKELRTKINVQENFCIPAHFKRYVASR